MVLIGVIGVGTMGVNHVRVLSEMKNVNVAICEAGPSLAYKLLSYARMIS